MALVTLAELKTFMGIGAGDVSQDAKLTAILAGVEASVIRLAREAGVLLEPTSDIIDYIDGDSDSIRLFLTYRPVVAVDEIKQSAAQDWDNVTAIPTSKYRVYSHIGLIKLVDVLQVDGLQSVRVKYDAGFSTPPNDLKLGIQSLASYMVGQAGKEGVASERIGEYSYTLRDIEKAPGIVLLLEPYINRPVVW